LHLSFSFVTPGFGVAKPRNIPHFQLSFDDALRKSGNTSQLDTTNFIVIFDGFDN